MGFAVLVVLFGLFGESIGNVSLEMGANEYSLLHNGSIWFVRFEAGWCGACKSSRGEWDNLEHAPELPKGLAMAYIDVDKHRAMAEAFGVRSIPSYFLIAPGGVGVLPFDKQLALLRTWFADVLPPRLEEPGWRTSLWENPLGWLWLPFVYIGVGVDRLQSIWITVFGVSEKNAIYATVGSLVFLLALYVLVLYTCLGCCFSSSTNNNNKKTATAAAAAAATSAKKAKKD